MEENIKNLIVKYLSYQDADVSEEQKQRMLVYGMNSPISSKYANSLRNLFQEYDENEVHQLAKSLVKKLQEKMSFFEFISGYGVSHSWAYWDIAKQYHYFKNEANSETNYYLANPMTDEKLQNQIVMRMLGWEFYHFQDIEILREKIEHCGEITEYLNKPPKEGGSELSSMDYMNLGVQISKIIV